MIREMFAIGVALVGFGSASSAYATTPSFDCTPVVYAFRHAEDVDSEAKPPPPVKPCLPGSGINCQTALTPVGMMHADLYLEMTTNLATQEDFCPVKVVYAVNPINTGNNGGEFGGTTNPYFTGKPLSDAVMNAAPIVDIDGKKIDEYLKNVAPATLKSIMLGITKSGASVAIFWTSQGLHTLGLALGTDRVPDKAKGATPPRNAAYIFKYNGGDKLVQPTSATEFVQCFNYAIGGDPKNNFAKKYYCGSSNGNLDVPEADFDRLEGRICSPGASGFTKITSPGGYFGYCKAPD